MNSLDQLKNYKSYINVPPLCNMRDLGGIVGYNQRKIRGKMLFRSNDLSNMNAADWKMFTNSGIQQIIDLRTNAEIQSAPYALPDGMERYHLPLMSDEDFAKKETIIAQVFAGKIGIEQLILPVYEIIDDLKINSWKKTFELLSTGKPTFWHCTDGKDRTGMTAALILTSLGVKKETILNDYMESNHYLLNTIEQETAFFNKMLGHGIGDMMLPLFGVKLTFIQAFYNAIEKHFGSMQQFITETLNVDEQKMRSIYLEE